MSTTVSTPHEGNYEQVYAQHVPDSQEGVNRIVMEFAPFHEEVITSTIPPTPGSSL